MEPLIIAEVLEKSGKVHERIKLTQFPAVLGRGSYAESLRVFFHQRRDADVLGFADAEHAGI
jgi:hypothetical protein